MNQLSLFTTEEKKVYEYFFLTAPDFNIRSKVKNEKLKLHNEIGLNKENLYSVPHISLFKFHNFSSENLILPLIKKALAGVKSFVIEINDLVVFDHGEKKSIVLDFINPEPIKEINDKILNEFLYKPHPFKPHLTIARSVANKDFRKIKNLKNYYFKDRFVCDNVTVLRKEIGSKQRYEVFGKVQLN